MAVKVRLSPNEQAALGVLESRFSQRARFPITLESLISDWETLVKEVQEGYPSTVDEYTNDLTARDLLEEVLCSLSEASQRKVAKVIRPLDEHFRTATCPDEDHVLSRYFRVHDGWWWSRIPARFRQGSDSRKA